MKSEGERKRFNSKEGREVGIEANIDDLNHYLILK
jgi:hypothetical protein